MKFLFPFAGLNEDDAESQFQGGLKKTLRFHKNLFFGNLSASGASAAVADPHEQQHNDERWSDEYETEDDDYSSAECSLNRKISKTSRFYRLNNLSLPLSDTIGEYVQELSNDRFFLDDLSFVFEMSRSQSVSPYAIIVAMLYLKRLKAKASEKASTDLSISNMELCLISILLASKYLTDEGEPEEIYNDDWARAADLTVADINRLEKRVLNQMDWDLYVSNEEFVKFSKELAQKITLKKIKLQFDMCTYSDLDCLLSLSSELTAEKVKAQLALFSKVFFVCSSTLVYLLFSSLLVSSCLVYLRSHIVHQYQMSLLKQASSILLSHTASTIPTAESNSLNVSHTAQSTEIANTICVLSARGATMNDFDSIERLLTNTEKSSENKTATSKGPRETTNSTMTSMNKICSVSKHVYRTPPSLLEASNYQPRELGMEEMFKNLFSGILVK